MTQTSESKQETMSLQGEIDRLSLEQALRDFEIANARVIDLTQRLISANEKVLAVQRESDELRVELTQLRSVHDAMRGSAAFRLATKIWDLRNAVRA